MFFAVILRFWLTDYEPLPRPSLRDPSHGHRDEGGPLTPPAAVSRPDSPYTMNPPIDFDGLSWPCTWFCESSPPYWIIYSKSFLFTSRSRHKSTIGIDFRADWGARAKAFQCCKDHFGMRGGRSRERGAPGDSRTIRKSHALLHQGLRRERERSG